MSQDEEEFEKNVDKWEIKPFKNEDNPHGLLEESDFTIMFPKSREGFFQEIFPYLIKKFGEYVK